VLRDFVFILKWKVENTWNMINIGETSSLLILRWYHCR